MDQPVGGARAARKSTNGAELGTQTLSSSGAFAGRRVSAETHRKPDHGMRLEREIVDPAGVARVVPADPLSEEAVRQIAVRVWGPAAAAVSRPGNRLLYTPAKQVETGSDLAVTESWRAYGVPDSFVEEAGAYLDRLARSPQLVKEVKSGLAAALGRVRGLEEETLRAYQLLMKCQCEGLADDESRWLHSALRNKLPLLTKMRGELVAALGRLRRCRSLSETDARYLSGLELSFDRAAHFWRCIGLAWQGPGRRVDSALPIRGETRVTVESRVVPGRVLGALFSTGYPSGASAATPLWAIYPHTPGLALSGLSNAANETLFLAVRHNFVGANDLNEEFLRRLSGDALRTLISNVKEACRFLKPTLEHCISTLQSSLAQDAASPGHASVFVQALNWDTREFICHETLCTALVANPHISWLMEREKPAGLGLFSVAMLTPDDVEGWCSQHSSFEFGQQPSKLVNLELRTPFTMRREYAVMVDVRQFPLSMRGPLGSRVQEISRASAERLFGRLDSLPLGGDLKTRIDDLRKCGRELPAILSEAREHYARLRRDLARDHPIVLSAQRELASVERQARRFDNSIHSLGQAGSELKSLWMRHGRWPQGELAMAVAARLALIGHLMGATPLLSCASGRDFVEQLDVRAKLLAAASDCDKGNVPSIGMEETASWRDARKSFANSLGVPVK